MSHLFRSVGRNLYSQLIGKCSPFDWRKTERETKRDGSFGIVVSDIVLGTLIETNDRLLYTFHWFSQSQGRRLMRGNQSTLRDS